jgi:hypothetical protein
MFTDFRPVADKAELLLLELGDLIQSGPRFRIVHRFRKPGTECAPGEEVTAVYFIYRGREIRVPLSTALLLLFDYSARNRHLPLNATQIAAGMRVSPFYRKHGLNSGVLSLRKMSRSSVKEYVEEIRKALALAFREASLAIDPKRVLVSEKVVGKGVQYRLRATVEWTHPEDASSFVGPSGSSGP